jgi:hypothetical protein
MIGRASLLASFGRSSTEKFTKMFKLQKKVVADDDIIIDDEHLLSGKNSRMGTRKPSHEEKNRATEVLSRSSESEGNIN